MNIMPLPVAASSHGLTAALARSATPTSKSCKARKLEFQDPAAMLFGRTEQMTVPSFPRRRQNTGLCDHLSCRGGERPHLSNTPSRRITDERDTGFHWALRRGGWGRTPVGNPSLGACLPLLCPSMSCADSLQFLLPPRGGQKVFSLGKFCATGFLQFELPGFSRFPWTGLFPASVDRGFPGFGGGR